jgi:periodic tryptophan protein 1
LVAVGTFEPEIEIWDLDVIDVPTPVATLGGQQDREKSIEDIKEKGKKKNKKKKANNPNPNNPSFYC